jgi:hypothetical protein
MRRWGDEKVVWCEGGVMRRWCGVKEGVMERMGRG